MTTLTDTSPRRRPRALGFLVAAAVIVVGSYAVAAIRPVGQPAGQAVVPDAAGSAQPPVAAPKVPAAAPQQRSDGGGTSAASLAQIDDSIGRWTKNLEGNPSDFLAATNLALLYHGRGRLSADLTDYERGLAAARTALDIVPSHGPARAAEASILFSLHDFAGAYAAADALVRADPSDIGALATRFDAGIELGRIDDARADLARLDETGGPAVLIREARLASVTGDPDRALKLATAARAEAVEDDAEDVGFYAYAVGEYARLAGDAQAARAAFAEALAIRSDDLGALIGLARVDAFEGRDDAAIDGLRGATAIAPQPESLALLGDLQAARGEPAAESYDTVRFIGRLADVQATTFDRQLLAFELDHGGASEDLLARARRSVAERPDWSGHDLVAWTLYRLGRYDEAAGSISAAGALGADGARLRFHDGAIRLAAGDRAEGERLLRSALDLGPALDPLERAEATRLLDS
jgi:tetratricopeptide (TPR) repeat protein